MCKQRRKCCPYASLSSDSNGNAKNSLARVRLLPMLREVPFFWIFFSSFILFFFFFLAFFTFSSMFFCLIHGFPAQLKPIKPTAWSSCFRKASFVTPQQKKEH